MATPAASSVGPNASPWLLLIHQIPPKPDYLRVKISRRLQQVGAVAIKNSVYVLPRRAETHEDFQWLARETREGGGDALIIEATLCDGLNDGDVRALFDAARDESYGELLVDARALRKELNRKKGSGRAPLRRQLEQEVARLKRRFETVASIDFFGAPKRAAVTELLDELQRVVNSTRPAAASDRVDGADRPRGRTWVTRSDVHVDRIASAWLIRRFIDADAQLAFVDPSTYSPRSGELRFDMFDAEYTHEGSRCTFETLVHRFGLQDAALATLGEIVHDIDFKDRAYGRDETAGVARLIDGLAATFADDALRIRHGSSLFDALYASLSASSTA